MKKIKALVLATLITSSTVVKAQDVYVDITTNAAINATVYATVNIIVWELFATTSRPGYGHYARVQAPAALVQVQMDTINFLSGDNKTALLDFTMKELRKVDQLKNHNDVEMASEILVATQAY